jgi:ABC-type antimicrobial peptide transport system permease subunit
MALGARPSSVGSQVVWQSAILVGIGLAIGVAIVRAAGQVLSAVLYEVSSSDPRATATAGVLLLAATMTACVPAAVRAMRVEPVEGLRAE